MVKHFEAKEALDNVHSAIGRQVCPSIAFFAEIVGADHEPFFFYEHVLRRELNPKGVDQKRHPSYEENPLASLSQFVL